MPSPNIGARAVNDDHFADVELHPQRNIHGHDDHSLPSAEEVRIGILPTTTNKRKVLVLSVLAGIAILFVIVIPTSVVRHGNKNNAPEANMSQPSRFQETLAFLSEYVDNIAINTQGSPQFRAAEWMADDDPMRLPLERGGQFLQRYALVVFYHATQGESAWTHQLKFLTANDECDWNFDFTKDDGKVVTLGVLCDDNSVVKQLVIGT